ncbi:MAG: hypothetical protein ABSC90_07270, partial [Acidimicrobiales bacterium]
LRYSFSALIIGLVLLPILPMMAKPRAQWSLLGVFGSALIAAQFDSTIWPTSFFAQQFGPPIRGIDSQIGLGIGVLTFVLGTFLLMRGAHTFVKRRSMVAILAAVAVIVLAVGGYRLQQLYLTDRYQNTTPMAPLYAWAQHVHDTRMAITGPFTNDSYPLYGRDDSNYVQIVGEPGPHGAFSPVTACEEFWKVIKAGQYNDIVTVTGSNGRTTPVIGSQALMWVDDDPKAKLIFRRTTYGYLLKETIFSVFHLNGTNNAATCIGQ